MTQERPGRTLVVGPMPLPLTEVLRSRYDSLELPDGEDRAAFLAEHSRDVATAVTTALGGVSRAVMESLPNLGAVINVGVGYDRTDTGYAAERGIGVSNTPGVLTDTVADTAVGLVIDSMRRLPAADRFVRSGHWSLEHQFPLTRQVTGARVGIVGLGRIGSAIATRLAGFACTISYHNRRPVADAPYPYVATAAELAAAVDVLVVAASGGSESRHLVDRAVLDALGPDGFLVNVGRGSVVDEDALVELLVSGGLAGAGLDVYANEPQVPAGLLDLDNVVLLPHVGSASVEARDAMAQLALRNLDQYRADGTLITPVVEPRSRATSM